ncbi:MAG: hypothetical protein ACRDQU_06875 [Pseudonocardiaceae bacterium]
MGIDVPVVIEAQGVRHEIAVSMNPGGKVEVHHDPQPSARAVGTAVTVTLPGSAGGELDEFDPAGWARSFALVNPHAAIQLAYAGQPGQAESYKSTVGEGWSKPVPTDPQQIHWYDIPALTRLIFEHIGNAEAGGRDLPLGEFVRRFAGLTSTIKAKKAAAALPNVTHLSDLSPTFGDPLGRTSLRSGEVIATGAASFLARCDAFPDDDNDGCRAVVAHLISPAVEFVDKGKVALVVPPAVAEAAAGALAFVGKTLRTEKQAAERDARKARHHREQQRRRVARVNAASSPSSPSLRAARCSRCYPSPTPKPAVLTRYRCRTGRCTTRSGKPSSSTPTGS